jgi:hypothetical protein
VKRFSIVLVLAVICGLMFSPVIRAVVTGSKPFKPLRVHATVQHDDAGAADAFESMVTVLHHPRCMNCHSKGDFPRQGDDSHRHTMNVRRGLHGNGVAGMRCSTCHQDFNLAGLHVPPGAPEWHLPSPAMPMIWEGLTDRQLCELFKDPKQNGNRTVDEIVEHMNTPLVLWGWNPGEGRTRIPVPQKEFLAKVKEWAAKGAACPEPPGAPGTGKSSGKLKKFSLYIVLR